MRNRNLIPLFVLILLGTLLSLFATRWTPEQPHFFEVQKMVSSESYAEPFRSLLVRANLEAFGAPGYPYVETSPTQKKFLLVLTKERQDQSEEPIFFAHKRVAEMVKFHDSLSYQDWEQQLLRHSEYVQRQINKVETAQSDYVKTTLYSQIYRYLLMHDQDLLRIASEKNIEGYNSAAFVGLTQRYFAELMSRVPEEVRDTQTAFYYPTEITAQKQFGEYYLKIEVASESAERDSFGLRYNDQNVTMNVEDREGKRFLVTEPLVFSTYDDKIDFKHVAQSTASGRIRPSIYAQETLASAQRVPSFRYTSSTQTAGTLVFSNFSVREQENLLQSLGYGWRVSGSDMSQPDVSTYTLHYWPKTLLNNLVLFAVPFFFVVLLIQLIATHTSLKPIAKLDAFLSSTQQRRTAIFSTLTKLHLALLPVRLPMLLGFMLGLLVDVILLNRTSFPPLTAGLLAMWVLVAIGYRVRERTHFALGIIFFLLIPIFLIVNKEPYAEKISNWSYIFFVAGTVELLFRQVYRDHSQDSVRKTLLILVKDIYRPFRSSIHQYFIPFIAVLWKIIITFRKALLLALSLILILMITISFNQHTEFYIKYYRDDGVEIFLWKTAIFQVLAVIGLIGLLFTFLKQVDIQSKVVVLFLGVLIVQAQVFRLTTHQLRTQAVITGLSRSSGTMWTQVTVYGNNFGNAPYNDARVVIEGVPQRVLDWKNDQIIFVVDPINTRTGNLWVVNFDFKKTNEFAFEYIPL